MRERVRARLRQYVTNGADVKLTTAAAGGIGPDLAARVRAIRGVAAVEPFQHRFAYVGNDLQDIFGIDARRIGAAAGMSDAFFAGGHATTVLARLAATPDAVLVSEETVRDFQLQPGDLVRLRLQFASDAAYHVVPFHYIGVVREFPTAPRDSFLIANASYLSRTTGSAAVSTLLVKSSRSPRDVAAAIRNSLGTGSGLVVTDVSSELNVTLSALTAIDLAGLTRLELSFAFLLAAAASGLLLGLGLVERRRIFSIASALGARTRQLAVFVWSEALFATAGGVLLGTLTGWGLAYVLVKTLTGVFDPPPEHLVVPWSYLGAVAAVTLVAVAVAGMFGVRSTHRPATQVLRDL